MSDTDNVLINRIHGSKFISHYYRIYFPASIIALLIGYIFGPRIMSSILGHEMGSIFDTDDLASSIRAQYDVQLTLAFLTPILVIVLADLEMKKNNLRYQPLKNNLGPISSIVYLFAALGMYFFTSYLITLLFSYLTPSIFPINTLANFASPDFSVIFTYRLISVDKSLTEELLLIVISFILTYASYEFILRGLMTNDARVNKLGVGGMVWLPAFIQAITFTNGTLIYQNFKLFIYSYLSNLMLGLFAGILLWRTRRFLLIPIYSVFVFFLKPGGDFQAAFLRVLPEVFGEFNLYDNTVTFADELAGYFNTFQVLLLVAAPVFMILAFQETWVVLKGLFTGLKKQYMGILVVSLAFLVIDLVFSFLAGSSNPFGFLAGLILALFIIGFVIQLVLQLLPQPSRDEMMMMMVAADETQSLNEKYPVNVNDDIAILKKEPGLWENPWFTSIFAALGYLYLLYISGGITQLQTLTQSNVIRYLIFFVFLPTILVFFATYFFTRSIRFGYFFAESWRRRMNLFLFALFWLNLLIWVRGAAIIQFSWTSVPLFVAYAITIWPKPIRSPLRDFSYGLGRDGRAATLRWLEHSPQKFIEASEKLLNSEHFQVVVGTYLSLAKINAITEDDLLKRLDGDLSDAEKTGISLALGLVGSKSAEGVLLNLLGETELEVKKAAFWALGKIGTKSALDKMVATLEGNPIRGLVKIAEEAILEIDPNYPLAGLRDPLTMAL